MCIYTYGIYLLERTTVNEREIEFHLLVYSPNGHNNPVWTRPKSGTRNSILVALDDRGLSTGAIFFQERHISRELDQYGATGT